MLVMGVDEAEARRSAALQCKLESMQEQHAALEASAQQAQQAAKLQQQELLN